MYVNDHIESLKRMYLAAPSNRLYLPLIDIGNGTSTIILDVHNWMFHSANGVHGSVYFKMLEDSAFFAVNSLEEEYFVITTSFNTYITRPVSSGEMRAVGKVVTTNKSQWIAESIVYNDGKEVGRGSGVLMRSKMPLSTASGYCKQ